MSTTRLYAVPIALVALALAAFGAAVLAENIDPANDNSQFAWSENAGWLNAEPANCGNCGVQVTATSLTGYMWGENLGWINLSCQNNNTCAGPAGNWGVTNNGSGVLSGYAWAENAGWISFSCANNPSTCPSTGNYSVNISPSTGIFSGHAWGENIGWISFSDSSPVAYRVQALIDADADGVQDGTDNCPAVANAGQANADGDALGDACEAAHCVAVPNWWTSPGAGTDPDCDGFTTAIETDPDIATDPNDSCANTATSNDENPDDKWPADFNDNRIANTLDLTGFASRMNTIPSTALDRRHDLNQNGVINTLDLVIYATAINRMCGP